MKSYGICLSLSAYVIDMTIATPVLFCFHLCGISISIPSLSVCVCPDF